MCLPSVYLTSSHVTRSPRPSPAVFHTGSDEILAVGTAWERGYTNTRVHKHTQHTLTPTLHTHQTLMHTHAHTLTPVHHTVGLGKLVGGGGGGEGWGAIRERKEFIEEHPVVQSQDVVSCQVPFHLCVCEV